MPDRLECRHQENIMQAKEYLRQYKGIVTKIRLLEEDILALEASIGSAPAPKDKDMPHTPSTRNTTEDMLVTLIDLKRDKEKLLHKAQLKRAEISGTIEALAHVNDPNAATYMTLLYDKYIKLMKWDEVAADLNFGEVYTRGALHGKALLAITPLIPVRK